MAFGKDKSVLSNVGGYRAPQSFRQQAAQTQQNRQKSSGGGRIPYFVNKYQPTTHGLDTIRVVKGDYAFDEVDQNGNLIHKEHQAFFPYTEHYSNRLKAGGICSAGPFSRFKDKKNPCLGCDEFFNGMSKDANGKTKFGHMSKRDLYAVTVLDYANYHKTPQRDQQGNVRTNDKGEPYYNWIKCEGRGCDGCAENLEVKKGHRQHWSMGSGHWNALLDANDLIGSSCAACGQKDCIQCLAWICSNPECGDALIDMAATTFKDDEIAEMTRKPMRCRTCGHEDFPQEVIECINCTNAGREPIRATIFDVDIKVKRIEDPNGGNQTTLSVSSWSEPRPVSPEYVEMAKQLDLPKIFAPMSIEEQEEKFGKRQPVTGGARQYQR